MPRRLRWCWYYSVCVLAVAIGLCANGITRVNALNVRKLAVVGTTVRVIRCDKVIARRANYSEYLITAESLDGSRRATVEVNVNRSALPQPSEVWKVDTSGWYVVFTERLPDR